MDMEHSMKIGFYDGLTGEQIEREATAEEIAEREAEIAIASAEDAQNRTNAETAYFNRVSAFTKMGLNEDEIAAMIAKPSWLE